MGYRAMTTAFLRAADAVARPIDRAGVAVCRTTRSHSRAPFSRLETVTHHIVARVVVVAHVAAARAFPTVCPREHGPRVARVVRDRATASATARPTPRAAHSRFVSEE